MFDLDQFFRIRWMNPQPLPVFQPDARANVHSADHQSPVANDQDEIIDADETAVLLKTSRRTVDEAARRGEFKSVGRLVGRSWRFRRQALLDWVAPSKTIYAEKLMQPELSQPEKKSPIPASDVEPWDWSDKGRNLRTSSIKSEETAYSADYGKVPDRSCRKGGKA